MQFRETRAVRVFIVADTLLEWGLQRLVASGAPRCEVVGSARQLAAALEMLQTQPADVALVAVHATTAELAAFCAQSSAKVLMMAGLDQHQTVDDAVMAGVCGVLREDDSPDELLLAIEKLHQGEIWVDRGSVGGMFVQMARHKTTEQNGGSEHSKIAKLTPRERQMISAIAADVAAPGKVIADRLCISEHTLRNHLTSIYSKLGVCNRLDLYAYVTRHGLAHAFAADGDAQGHPTGRHPQSPASTGGHLP